MNKIAQAIYLKRLEKGLTQKSLANRARIPQPNLSQIENGRDFKVSTLYRLAAALDMRPAELLGGVRPVRVGKAEFFRRENIERVAAYLAGSGENLPKKMKPAAQLLKSVLGTSKKGYLRKRDIHLDWARLKTAFSDEEIKAILMRVDRAGRRKP